jgi:hypothetical protein
MKYIPAEAQTMEALRQNLSYDAPLLLIGNSILEEAKEVLAHSGYIPTNLPCKVGKIYAHPSVEEADYADPCNLL